MRRINSILETVPEIQDPHRENERDPQGRWESGVSGKAEGSVDFSGLSFRYPGRTEYALKDVNLKIHPGETIAIVGRVGSGKTTLLQILPRLLDAPEDMAFVDGRDIRKLPLITLRKKIGFVSQDVFIFSDTVYNNVAFGTDDVTDEAVRQALEVAGIREEMEALEKGLGTLLAKGASPSRVVSGNGSPLHAPWWEIFQSSYWMTPFPWWIPVPKKESSTGSWTFGETEPM